MQNVVVDSKIKLLSMFNVNNITHIAFYVTFMHSTDENGKNLEHFCVNVFYMLYVNNEMGFVLEYISFIFGRAFMYCTQHIHF